jgi:elongation of very long chain fatty acids protein 4
MSAAYFSAALNSWVHVCMYMYYLIASLLPKDEKTRKKYLWWGKYLTQMQMCQFFLNLLQAAYCWQFSPYPKFMSKVRHPSDDSDGGRAVPSLHSPSS